MEPLPCAKYFWRSLLYQFFSSHPSAISYKSQKKLPVLSDPSSNHSLTLLVFSTSFLRVFSSVHSSAFFILTTSLAHVTRDHHIAKADDTSLPSSFLTAQQNFIEVTTSSSLKLFFSPDLLKHLFSGTSSSFLASLTGSSFFFLFPYVRVPGTQPVGLFSPFSTHTHSVQVHIRSHGSKYCGSQFRIIPAAGANPQITENK